MDGYSFRAQVDAIELYNPNKADIGFGGWYLSDDEINPIKFRILDGTIIKAEGYLVFNANDFNQDTTFSSFGLEEGGDDAVLSSDTTGCMGYCHGFGFGAIERGISCGRFIVPSIGNEVFVPLADVTLGGPNSDPLVGPLVISEIMFQAGDRAADYSENGMVERRIGVQPSRAERDTVDSFIDRGRANDARQGVSAAGS